MRITHLSGEGNTAMRSLVSLTLALAVLVTGSTAGATVISDYVGYGYETGGFLPSDAGDELVLVAVSTAVDPVTGADLSTTEVTFYAYGLISTGQTVDGAGNTIVTYTGGTLEVRVDPAMNADFGINPPNATTPSTFQDGLLLFQGAFTSFVVAIQPDGTGVYEGNLDGIAGALLNSVCSDCGYTWGGAWTPDSGAQILDGYDLQIDGKLDVLEAVSNETASFGALKSNYQR